MYSSLNSSSVGASIPAINDHVEDFHFGDLQKPFQKWQRKDKRRYVERFCSITTPEGQNGKTKNLQFTCKCCGKKFMGQLITAMIHLSGTRKASQRISVCPTPDEEIRSEILMIFTLDQEQGEDLTNDVGGDGMLMGDAFGNGLDLQHQQAPYLQHQIPQQSHQLAKRAAAKRKRETGKSACLNYMPLVPFTDLCNLPSQVSLTYYVSPFMLNYCFPIAS